jgi:hypothetical protein
MDLTVHIPDEAMPALRAKASGVSLEVFAEQVLLEQIQDEAIPVATDMTPPERRTGRLVIEAFAELPGLLSDEEIDRMFRRDSSPARPVDLS